MKTVKKEVYEMKPFRHITIKDPWYMNSREFSNRKDLVFDENARCCNVGMVIVKQMREVPKFGYDFIQVEIVLAKDKAQRDLYLMGKEYKNSRKTEVELGCETPQFVMEVTNKKGNMRCEEFDAGAYGVFGFAVKYKEYYGMRIFLELNEDVSSFDEIASKMSYLFGFDREKDLLYEEGQEEDMELE